MILLHFYDIYKSEYCKEHLHTLMYDWDIEEVVTLENQISMFRDIEDAQESDRKRAEKQNSPQLPQP